MEIKTVKINELKPHPKNPRVHPDSAIDKLVRSIKEYGWTNPVLVSADGYVLAGHARLKAAEKAGISEVPVIYLPLEGAKAEAYLIADNRLQDKTDWDYVKLKDILQELDTGEFDLELTGFDMDEIEDLIAQLHVPEEIVEDEVPEPPKEPITKPGDLWILGRHRLLCGDATKPEDYEKLLSDKKFDLVVTDPPYNVDYKGKTKEELKILNDTKTDEEFFVFLLNFYSSLFEFTHKGSAWYIWHPDLEGYNFRRAMKEAGVKVRQCLIWVKSTMTLGRQDYQSMHEPCLYGWKEGAPHKWFSDRKQKTVLNFDKPMRNADHPTMKPVDLIGYLIVNSSKKENIIGDPFLGSGSTMVACEQLNRICYGMELDPKYCQVIIDRMLNSYPDIEVKINGHKYQQLQTV